MSEEKPVTPVEVDLFDQNQNIVMSSNDHYYIKDIAGDEAEILGEDGSSFVYDVEGLQELKHFISLLSLDDGELDTFLKNIIDSIKTGILNNEKSNNVLQTSIVKFKIDIGEKAISLKGDVKYAEQDWQEFLYKHMTPNEARTLRTYMRIAKAKVNDKYYYLGTAEINRILSLIQPCKCNFNDFMENIISNEDLELRHSDEDEYIRHLTRRCELYTAQEEFKKRSIILTQEENEELKAAIDNGCKISGKEYAEFSKLKKQT